MFFYYHELLKKSTVKRENEWLRSSSDNWYRNPNAEAAFNNQQHEAFFCFPVCSHGSMVQQQEEGSRPSMLLITAAAQPTPACTETASVGQFRLHAPHSMQASLSCIHARSEPFMPMTAWGQTSMHMPQPIHFSSLRLSVTTSFR